ncbi:MAG: peptidase domain-containing ABC transporter [Ramlibacter sp.]
MQQSWRHALLTEEAVWALASVCDACRVAFDAALFLERHPPRPDGYRLADVLLAADALGLRHAPLPAATGIDATTALPVLAFMRPAAHPASPGASAPLRAAPIVITALDGNEVSFTQPDTQRSSTCEWSELLPRLEHQLCSFTPAPPPVRDEDGSRELAQQPFGFSWFVPELLRYRGVWRDILAASLALQVVGLATPLFTQVVIDKVVVHQSQSTLAAAGAGLALAVLFSAVFSWVRQYLILHTGNRVDAVLASKAFAHLVKLPMPYFQRRPTGTLVARLHGVETIREFLAGAAVVLLLDFPFMLILLCVMFWYSWQLTLVALGLVTVLSLLSAAVTPLFRTRLNRQFLLGARNQAFVTEYVAGMETVKSLQLEPQLIQRYGAYLADSVAAAFDTRRLANTYQTAANALEQLQGLAVLVIGAQLVMNNDGFTIGMLVAFQMFASRLSQPLLRMVGLYQEFQQANLSVQRLGDVMNAPPEPYSLVPARAGAGTGALDINGISFRYSPEHPWLYRNLSLSLQPGKTTLLVGPSGCGKSTLARLLLGFHRPAEGAILLDGRDIRHFSANELRARFGVVPQETMLFSGTVYDNLQMANPLAGFRHIVQACRMAEIHDVIEQLPRGYQTEIGEHGVGLSGGQKQRIAIARALLKRPRILIFDEATSSLDAQTAAAFARTINQLRGKVTIVFIAHQVPRGLHVDETIIIGSPTNVAARTASNVAQEVSE